MRGIVETLSNLDAATTISSGVVIALITIGRTVWYFAKKRREDRKAKEDLAKQTTSLKPEEIVDVLIPDTAIDSYMRVIRELDAQVTQLKADVAELMVLKDANKNLIAEVARLNLENEKLKRKVLRLNTKVNSLVKNKKIGRLPI